MERICHIVLPVFFFSQYPNSFHPRLFNETQVFFIVICLIFIPFVLTLRYFHCLRYIVIPLCCCIHVSSCTHFFHPCFNVYELRNFLSLFILTFIPLTLFHKYFLLCVIFSSLFIAASMFPCVCFPLFYSMFYVLACNGGSM